jgi:hypothetical protein
MSEWMQYTYCIWKDNVLVRVVAVFSLLDGYKRYTLTNVVFSFRDGNT